MYVRRTLAAIALALLLPTACAQPTRGDAPPSPTPARPSLGAARDVGADAGSDDATTASELGFALLNAPRGDDDRIVSAAAVSMAAALAQEAGLPLEGYRASTADLTADARAMLRVGLFADMDFELPDGFPDRAREAYGAHAATLDFADAAGAIDRMRIWLDEQLPSAPPFPDVALATRTAGVIASCVPSLRWANAFEVEEASPFLYVDGTQSDLPRMWQSGRMGYARSDALEAVSVPLEGGYACVFAMRSDGAARAPAMDAGTWDALYASLAPADVVLRLPICSASGTQIVDAALARARPDACAFFLSAMDVAFDERGLCAQGIDMPEPFEAVPGVAVDVDRPFFFAVCREGVPLVMGYVEQPLRIPGS